MTSTRAVGGQGPAGAVVTDRGVEPGGEQGEQLAERAGRQPPERRQPHDARRWRAPGGGARGRRARRPGRAGGRRGWRRGRRPGGCARGADSVPVVRRAGATSTGSASVHDVDGARASPSLGGRWAWRAGHSPNAAPNRRCASASPGAAANQVASRRKSLATDAERRRWSQRRSRTRSSSTMAVRAMSRSPAMRGVSPPAGANQARRATQRRLRSASQLGAGSPPATGARLAPASARSNSVATPRAADAVDRRVRGAGAGARRPRRTPRGRRRCGA